MVAKGDVEQEETKKALSIGKLCDLLSASGRRHNHGYFHYTNWESFAKMQTTKVDATGCSHRFLRLSNKDKLNDAFEKRMEDGTYIVSFSIGEEESIAQWKIYGADRDDAVRLKFRQRALTRWLDNFVKGAIKVYVCRDGRYLPLERNCRVRLIDVAYPSSSDKRNARMISVGGENIRMIDGWKRKIMEKKYAPFFKKQGWAHEREVRLVVDKTGLDADFIYVPFDGPFDDLVEEFMQKRSSVMRGPWYDEKACVPLGIVRGITLAKMPKSDYEGEVLKTDKGAAK